jgi:tetratricopeptide (TPR) repeat protein
MRKGSISERVLRVIGLAVWGLSMCVPLAAQQSQPLPQLPQITISELPAEVQFQVRQAYDHARQDPRSAEASGKLGMLLDLYHHPEQARVCYERAHQLDPGAFKWLYYLGSLQARQGQDKEAVETFRAALRLKPGDLPVRLKLGESLLRTGELDASAQIYSAIIKEAPEGPSAAEAYWGLGRIEVAKNDWAAAQQSFGRACGLFPTYGAAHYELSQVDRKLKRSEQAEDQLALYNQHPNLVPPVDDPLRDELRNLDRSAASLLERGVELEQAGRTDDAIAAEEEATRLDPKLVRAHVNLIILYGRTGDFQRASEHFQAAVALDPKHIPDAYYNFGVLLMKRSELAEAAECFRKALQLEPEYADAHNDLGYLLERQGKLAEAADEYRKAIQEKPDFRQAHFNLGRILVNQQQYPEAIQELQLTLSPVDENTPSYLYALGAAYGRAGDQAAARRYLEQAKTEASARKQGQLVADIERDIQKLGGDKQRR